MTVVATFYKFVSLEDLRTKQETLLQRCLELEIQGTILLAPEGINGTIAGSRHSIDAILAWLRSHPALGDLEHKESFTSSPPFQRMKVRLKEEIVTLGMPEVQPSQQVGTYVSPKDWNQLIADPEVTVIDTRNQYEIEIGSFKGAKNPETESFREFPQYVHGHLDPQKQKKLALFCTGGIRCEKATSYLLSQGFTEVYHLKGGILKYLAEVPQEESLWQGECFVFDHRTAVNQDLEKGSYDMCLSCGHPINHEDKTSEHYQEGVSCPYCIDSLTPEKKARQEEKQKQLKLKLLKTDAETGFLYEKS